MAFNLFGYLGSASLFTVADLTSVWSSRLPDFQLYCAVYHPKKLIAGRARNQSSDLHTFSFPNTGLSVNSTGLSLAWSAAGYVKNTASTDFSVV